MIVLIFLSFCSLLFMFTPNTWLLGAHERFLSQWLARNELFRGGQLLLWLDSLGLGEVGFNLNIRLPDRECFRHYGQTIHELWEEVRSKGGELRPLLQILRKELRGEILRAKKEKEYLKGAYSQVLMMLGLVYGYLFAFTHLIQIQYPSILWPLLFGFQAFGIFLFFILLKRLRIFHFSGLGHLSLCLLQMKLISQRGNLGSFVLRHQREVLKGEQYAFFQRLEQILEQWKRDSRIQIQYLTELEDDLQFIREIASEKFMAQLKILCFMWSLLFVLPILFGASLFGLYELTVV